MEGKVKKETKWHPKELDMNNWKTAHSAQGGQALWETGTRMLDISFIPVHLRPSVYHLWG